MKTKTQEQLEKELEDLRFIISKGKGIELHFLIGYKKDISEREAKLSQHKTDIKKFEKLIDEKINSLEKKWKDIHTRALNNRSPDIEEIYNKTALPSINEIKEQIKLLEEIKEALKNL